MLLFHTDVRLSHPYDTVILLLCLTDDLLNHPNDIRAFTTCRFITSFNENQISLAIQGIE